MSRPTEQTRPDLYSRVTNQIIEDLERGVRPWTKPWSAAHAQRAADFLRGQQAQAVAQQSERAEGLAGPRPGVGSAHVRPDH